MFFLSNGLRALFIVFILFGCSDGDLKGSKEEPKAILIDGSGTYSREISTNNPLSQNFFDQGLRFAWGFYFPESIASYQESSRLDPDHPMPYWGMAHAMGPNPNSRYARMPDDPKGEGLNAINKALEKIQNADPLEKRIINALYVFYDKESIPDPKKRDQSYLAEMRILNNEFPDDPDIAALYAGSYMSIRRWDYWDSDGTPKGETIEVAEALEHIIKSGQSHPGVYHLHIHLIEASMEPERALVSANALEATVPIVGHVVHMPAHIYVRLGQYQKAIDNNIRSQKVDLELSKLWGDMPLPNIGTYPLSHKIHAGHALDFIRYAATVQGNFEIANKAAWNMANRIKGEAAMVMGGQKRVSAPWLVLKIFGKWDEILSLEPEHQGTPYLDGIWSYVIGSAHIAKGNFDLAKIELDKLNNLANSPNADQYRVGATPASSVLKVAAYGLQGEFFSAKGEHLKAVHSFQKGVNLEDQNNYTEPPDWAQPMRHYLGAALLKLGEFQEAEKTYRRDLQWNQNNGWSLYGLYKSLELQGRKTESKEIYTQWNRAWEASDIKITASHL
jgi:tetratricopeptide (TPR) repeat protein